MKHLGPSTLVTGFALLGTVDCTTASLEQGAQEEFTKKFSCPSERVKVEPRSDLKAYDVTFGPPPPPPADIAGDPGRLAIWQQREDELRTNFNNFMTVLKVTGCDKDVMFTCSRAQKHPSNSNGIVCNEVTRQGATGSSSGSSSSRTPAQTK